MACKYSDGTDMKVGDTVKYKTLDTEYYSRGYGISYETKTSKIVGFKVVLENGDREDPTSITKQSGGKRRSTTRKRRS